ncbi:MAG: hypothetical protein ACPGOZ_05190 [Candidatus Puniceispirillum sp.]
MYDELLAEHKVAQAQVAKQIASVQARVESGVGRLSDLRAAKLIGLDLEIAASRLESQREQVIESLDIDLGLTPGDAKHLFATYMERRPLSLAAYDPSRYGVLMGVVQRVANNTTQPENQMPFYETMIEIPKIELTKSPIRPEITAGMPLTVDILGDKRTVMNYIMTPIQKSLKTAFREK